MPPRPKNPNNADLPINLTSNRQIFIYRTPAGKFYSLGACRERAIHLAKQMNGHYATTDGLFDKVIEGEEIKQPTFSQFIDEFREAGLAPLRLAPSTAREYRRMLGHVSRFFLGQVADDITTQQIARFLRGYPPRTSRAYRSLLLVVFKHAKSEGLRTAANPVTDTLPRPMVIQRERLTASQYGAVWAKATAHIRNAMDLALYTLQRREDIAELRFADNREGHLWVRPKKVAKYGVAIRIAVHEDLATVIARCRDGILSPWMVHQPGGANAARCGKKLAPASLSRGFRRARDKADPSLFPEAPRRRPSFHEIRALGAKQLRDAGVDPQSLLGHRDAQTTRLYLDRHDVHWITVSARVSLD